MAALETCNAFSKLVILRSQTSSPFGPSARIPSVMLPGLFMTGQLAPATPKPAASPFPMSEVVIKEATGWEVDEADIRTPSPKSFSGQRKQSAIDPTLVRSGLLHAVMMLMDWHSHCTNVSMKP